MKFSQTQQDKIKWAEFHTPDFGKKQMQVKRAMQADLINAIDELAVVVETNAKRSSRLQEAISDRSTSEEKLHIYRNGIIKYDRLSDLAKNVSEIYLILLDVHTYGTYCLLATDEWDWRAFVRHIYTILYEHSKTVNRQLNDIVKILKEELDEDYDISELVRAKKDFSSFISDNSPFSKQIRVNVDAHFDGDFVERLKLIENLSYAGFIELYHTYYSKMHGFLSVLKPALEGMRRAADVSFYSMFVRE